MRRIFRGEFRGLEVAGFASLMCCGRHQTGVPPADFRATAFSRDGDFEDRRWILDNPSLDLP
jgi:hypothetical protein